MDSENTGMQEFKLIVDVIMNFRVNTVLIPYQNIG